MLLGLESWTAVVDLDDAPQSALSVVHADLGRALFDQPVLTRQVGGERGLDGESKVLSQPKSIAFIEISYSTLFSQLYFLYSCPGATLYRLHLHCAIVCK